MKFKKLKYPFSLIKLTKEVTMVKKAKTIGYVLSGLGLLGLASTTFPEIQESLNLSNIPTSMVTIVTGALIVIGVLLILKSGKSSKKNQDDLPVYEGEKVVAYRRNDSKK
jgi:hypothetical protein